MEIETQERKREIQKYKYHVDLSNDPQITEIKEHHKDLPKTQKLEVRVRDEDVKALFERYGNDEDMDLYTIAEALCIDESSVTEVCKSEKYKDLYQTAKLKRGEKFVQKGYEVASTPFDKIQDGQEVSMVEVAAAKLKSNYSYMYGRSLNTQFNPQKDNSGENGGVNVIVNTGIKLNF